MSEKLSASELGTLICDKLGVEYHAGDGHCTVDGIDVDEYMQLDMKSLEYKGYKTIPNISILDGVYYGNIAGIKDMITYQSDTVEGITEAFHLCVDDYLDFCKEIGKEPEKPCVSWSQNGEYWTMRFTSTYYEEELCYN